MTWPRILIISGLALMLIAQVGRLILGPVWITFSRTKPEEKPAASPWPCDNKIDWNIGVMSGANRMMDMARDGYLTNAHSQQETIDELFRRCYVEWPKYRP